jgi:predicted enzyme related to lactoylglutathione lyase
MPHFQVSDVAASAARAMELGGQELIHGKGDDGQSQWAVLVDPNGAAFGVIPALADESEDAGQAGRIGRISWLTLVVSDLSSACEFYEQVVGWSAGPVAKEGAREMRRPDGVAAAEICPTDNDTRGFSHLWLLSLPVGDLAESLRRVREGGGEVAGEIGGSGSTVIRDPAGVFLALQADE